MSRQSGLGGIAVLALIGLPLQAGSIQGVVIEHASGRALSRTAVFLTPVPQSAAAASDAVKPVAVRTGLSGQFQIPSVAPGLYVLSAVRDGFFPGAYGQRLPAGRGAPITVTADSHLFAEIRLRHKGAITGRVLDENGVGMPKVPVVAYRARLPLRSVASGNSDDRGVYRIPGLEPGKYWVRSAAHTFDDGSTWIPAFAPQGHEVRDARVFPVTVDADSAYADVSPLPGGLYSVSGTVSCDHPGDVVVTLSSDTGQQMARTFCGPMPGTFSFPANPLGLYEIFATFQDNSGAAFAVLDVGGRTTLNLALAPPSDVSIEARIHGSMQLAGVPVKIIARRQTLSESGPVFELRGKDAALPPGYWEFRATPPPGHYVHSIATTRTYFAASRRPNSLTLAQDWYEIQIPGRQSVQLRVMLGRDPARLEGTVLLADGKKVPGAPVFLWPVAESVRRSLGGAPQTLSAVDGSWAFDGLPPGDYRVLSTFDASDLDSDEILEASHAPLLKLRAGQTSSVDLPLWTAPW